MLAYLFPGQGSQRVGMGADLAEAFSEARAVFEEADDVLGFSLTALMFGTAEDAEEALKQTENTQPALYTHSLAALAVLQARGQQPDVTAGHSLGEYSALAAAGAFSFADGLRTVRKRGELMAQARAGTMAAVLGLDDAIVEQGCAEASEAGDGVVVAANYNAPGQVVISGDVAAVDRAMETLKAAGAKRVLPLPVSGAFHSPLMAAAQAEFGATLDALAIQAPRCPVVLNVTATPTTDPDEIRRRLVEQLTAPVRWTQSLGRMQADGAARFVEVGTGTVLSGLVKRTLGRATETAQAGSTGDFE
ncbi:MAG: ACP S-malonyltransferase [Bacteroidota bacterium]